MAIGGGAMEGQILRAPPWTAAHVRAAVAAVYSRVGTSPAETFRFPVGPALAHQLGYPEDLLQSLPPTAIESFTGVACAVLAAHPIEVTGEVSHHGASEERNPPTSRSAAHPIPEG